MFDFKTMATLASAVTGMLCLVLLILPALIFWLFGIEGGADAAFMSRRAGCLFLGIAVLLWCFRGAPLGDAQKGVCLAVSAMMSALAVLGLVEFLRGAAGYGIWLAIFAEVGFSTAFGLLWWRQKDHGNKA